ncbi:MAG: SH3 domain-containing protein [Gemmobacter sp.]
MRRFILLTTLLGLGLYGTLSVYGEGDQQRRGLAEARVMTPLAVPEPPVSRDAAPVADPAVAVTSGVERPATATLSPAIQRVALSAGASPVVAVPVAPEPAVALASPETAAAAVRQEPTVSETAPARDERRVNTAAANVRAGPSTEFSVVGRVTRGEVVEVVAVDPAGWARIRSEGDGIEGWVAMRLLTD